MVSVLKLLAQDSFLTLNKHLVRKFGLEAAAIYADLASAQLFYQEEGIEYPNWFYRTREKIKEETSVNDKQQVKAIKLLKESGLLKSKLKGVPAVSHYLIDSSCVEKLLILLSQNGAASYSKMEHLDTPKRSTIKNKNNKNKDNKEKEVYFKEKKEALEYPPEATKDLVNKIEEFFRYREDIKKPLKHASKVLKINQLVAQVKKYGDAIVISSIEEAMCNGWQGTFIKNPKIIRNDKPNNSKREQTVNWYNQTTTELDPNSL